MAMSFKGWNYSQNYSQEGLEVLPTQNRVSRITPAFLRTQPDVSPLSAAPIHRSTRSFMEQEVIEKSVPPTPRLVYGVPLSTFLLAIIAAMAIATAGILGGLLEIRSKS